MRGLRGVDISVFLGIHGFFAAMPITLGAAYRTHRQPTSEKAADVLHAEATA